MPTITATRPLRTPIRGALASALCLVSSLVASPARALDQVYFSSNTNITDLLVQRINAEQVRVEISSWYLSEHSISIAIANKFAAKVPVRVIGDRAALFENDPNTKREYYRLASQGVPIRLRFNPTWFPELDHWKAAIFVGQNVVAFGSSNFAPVELAPFTATNYADDSVLFTDDSSIVAAFKTKFDRMWNDTTREPESIISGPPYLKDWNEACAVEPTGGCSDYTTLYPIRAPMVIDTARLEPDYPLPADLYWGQGSQFNSRLTREILNETQNVRLVVYRLGVSNITEALLDRFQSGVAVRLIIEPQQYANNAWPEYWITHANIDRLWASGVPVKQRIHQGVTHLKTLITSAYATNASSNFTANWQRDHNYFVSAIGKPAVYQAFVDRFEAMWNDTAGFGPFTPTPPNAAEPFSPLSGATAVPPGNALVWNRASWAVSYDIYLGTSPSSMTLVANVPAQIVQDPPTTYSWTPTQPLLPNTTYYWQLVSRTFATPRDPSMIAVSSIWSFTTGTPSTGSGGTGSGSGGSGSSGSGSGGSGSGGTGSGGTGSGGSGTGSGGSDPGGSGLGGTGGTGSNGGGPLPSSFRSQDVGAVNVPGTISYANGVFTIRGAGADVWGTSDSFHYIYRTITGDAEIVARVASLQNTNTFAKAGVMLRQGMAAGSAHVILDVRPNGEIEFMQRSNADTSTAYLGGTTPGVPSWLRLARSGSTVSAYVSGNGSSWTPVGTTTVSMTSDAFVGLVVNSHEPSTLNTAVIDNVTVSAAPTSPPPPAPPPAPGSNIVIYASDVPANALKGGWVAEADPTSPNGTRLVTADNGVANTSAPLAAPSTYVDITFEAPAGVSYRIWVRLRALSNSKFNDAIWLQFSDAQIGGSAAYPMDSASGLLVNLATDSAASSLNNWGWTNGAYWLSQPSAVTFPIAGSHTLRVQIREDGVGFDQIVLSPSTYFNAAPGGPSNDGTIVAKP